MADDKPLFTALEKCILQQGVQKLINECDEHCSNLVKGQQSYHSDSTLQQLTQCYSNRKEECQKLLAKLSTMFFPSLNTMQV